MGRQFKDICRMSQGKLKDYVANELLATYNDVVNEDGFVYAQGTFPVLLVAHLDTVHEKNVQKIIDKKGKISSPQGIGGDDRCGVYMVLQIAKQVHCSVLFCEDEESGGIGAEKFTKTSTAKKLVGEFNYILEFDRKGNNDAVFYECDNKDFEDFITKEFFKTSYGSFSDISVIAPELECAAVNLSCGYYNAHTKDEYVVYKEMEIVIREAVKLLKRTNLEVKYEYIPLAPYSMGFLNGYDYGYYDDYFYGDEVYTLAYFDIDNTYKECEIIANSEYEALGKFCCENPELTYNHIMEIRKVDELC